MFNRDNFLLQEAYKRVVIINNINSPRSLLKENLYIKWNNTVVFADIEADNDKNLGEESNVLDAILIAKFVGTNKSISDKHTQPYSNLPIIPKVFIGYRVIENIIQRTFAMSSIKGTANYSNFDNSKKSFKDTRQPKPNINTSYNDVNPYYPKEFTGLSEQQYEGVISKAINVFITNNDDKYDFFVVPSSNSHNALHIAQILKEFTGSPQSEIKTLDKLTINPADPRFLNVFDTEKITEMIWSKINTAYPNINKQNVIDAVNDVLNDWGNTDARYYREFSTARHTRPTRMDAIERSVLNKLGVNLPNEDKPMGGRLDSFSKSHFNPVTIDTFVKDVEKYKGAREAQDLPAKQDTINQNITAAQNALDKLNDRYKMLHDMGVQIAQRVGIYNKRNIRVPYDQQTPPENMSAKDRDRLTKRLDGIDDAMSDLLKPMTDALGDLRTAERARPKETKVNIMYIDDNINSGDMYKQLYKVIESTHKMCRKIQFFFLLCKEDYAR